MGPTHHGVLRSSSRAALYACSIRSNSLASSDDLISSPFGHGGDFRDSAGTMDVPTRTLLPRGERTCGLRSLGTSPLAPEVLIQHRTEAASSGSGLHDP